MNAVTVACRVRPLHSGEEAGSIAVDHTTVSVDTIQGKRSFSFDHVFNASTDDEAVWEQLKLNQWTQKVLEGYHTTVMAYGQTGSGKTYTIDGGPSENGVVCRAARSIFEQMHEKEGSYVIRVSYMQLYLEKTFDLLNPAPWLLKTTSDKRRVAHLQKQPGLRMRKSVNGWFVENLYETECANADEVISHWKFGRESKQMAQTTMNAHSSRSHSIFVIQVEKQDPSNFTYRCVSKLSIVDLAGSEKPTGTTSARFQESVNINGSLFVLRKVVTALVQGAQHVPYRESKLTCLLKQSIGGSSYLVLLACVNPTHQSTEESLSTLHYATQASHIQNLPKANKDPRLELMEEMKAEIAHLQRYIVEDLKQPLPPESLSRAPPRRTQSANPFARRKSTKTIATPPTTSPSTPQTTTPTTPRPLVSNGEALPQDDTANDSNIADAASLALTKSVPALPSREHACRKKKRAPEAGERYRAFLAETERSGVTPPRNNVRALARWFHEQRKEVLYGPPSTSPRISSRGAQTVCATGVWRRGPRRPRRSKPRSARGVLPKVDQDGYVADDSSMPRQVSIEELMTACRKHGDEQRNAREAVEARLPVRSATPPGDSKSAYATPLYEPSRPSTPLYGGRRPLRAQTARPSSGNRFFSSGRTTPALSSGCATPRPRTPESPRTPNFNDLEPEMELLRDENSLLENKHELYLEQIRTLENCNDGLQQTLHELHESSSEQRKMEKQIIAQLETAYHDATESKRVVEDNCAQNVAELDAKLKAKDLELQQATGQTESLSRRLSAVELVAISNLKTVGNEAPEDLKLMLRDILSEWADKRFITDKHAQELRKEVAVLRKKKGMLLSMMGKVEALQIKEDVKLFRARVAGEKAISLE